MNSPSLPAVLGQQEAGTKPGNNSLSMRDREGSPVKGEPEDPRYDFQQGDQGSCGLWPWRRPRVPSSA